MLVILAGIPESAGGQRAPAGQSAGQDCERIKSDIQLLQEDLAELSAELQRLSEVLDQTNKDISTAQKDLSTATAHANAGLTNQTIRGELLDILARMLKTRHDVKQQIEDDTQRVQAIKDEIADLLDKLAACGRPSATQPLPESSSVPQLPPGPEKSGGDAAMIQSLQGAIDANQPSQTYVAPPTQGANPETPLQLLPPLGNRVLVGPTAGYTAVNGQILSTIGSQPPPKPAAPTAVHPTSPAHSPSSTGSSTPPQSSIPGAGGSTTPTMPPPTSPPPGF